MKTFVLVLSGQSVPAAVALEDNVVDAAKILGAEASGHGSGGMTWVRFPDKHPFDGYGGGILYEVQYFSSIVPSE